MMLRQEIEARVQVADIFANVSGAAGLKSILTGGLVDSGCYIFRESKIPKKSERVNAVSQQVELRYAFVISNINVADAQGADASDISEQLQESLQQCILGWSPSSAHHPFEYVDGRLISFQNGFYLFKESYQTMAYIRVP